MGAECFKCHGDLTYDGNCPTCEARTDRDRLRAERDEARADLLSLSAEIATLFGPCGPPPTGVSINEAQVALMGRVLGELEEARDEARRVARRMADLARPWIGSAIMVRFDALPWAKEES